MYEVQYIPDSPCSFHSPCDYKCKHRTGCAASAPSRLPKAASPCSQDGIRKVEEEVLVAPPSHCAPPVIHPLPKSPSSLTTAHNSTTFDTIFHDCDTVFALSEFTARLPAAHWRPDCVPEPPSPTLCVWRLRPRKGAKVVRVACYNQREDLTVLHLGFDFCSHIYQHYTQLNILVDKSCSLASRRKNHVWLTYSKIYKYLHSLNWIQ